MADDVVELDALAAGDDVAVEKVGTRMYQQVKLVGGALTDETKIGAGAGLEATALRVTLPTDGTGIVGLAATEASNLADVDTAVTAMNAKFVTGTVIGDVNLGASDATNLNNVDTATTSIDGKITACDTGAVVISSGTTAVTNAGTFAVQVSDTSFAVADGNALGEGVLIQGDDGTDRKNINVDATTGDVQVDVTNTVTVDGSGVTQPVSGTVEVTGVATAANQLPDGHNVTVDNASIAVTNAGLTELAAAINTSQLDVNIATDSVGIGGGTQYTEDAVAAADPIGNAQILVREDAPTSIAVDGDNVARRGTQYGAAYTQIVDSSGNFINTFGGSGGTATADDADFVAGTTQGTIAQGVYESTPSSVTDGDVGAVGISSTRRLLTDSNVTLDAETTKVIGTVRVASGGIASGGIVDLPLPAGAATQATLATIDTDTGNIATAVQLIDNPIVAHDAAASGSTGVNMAGGYATNSVEGVTQVANADASHIATDLNGVTLTRNGTTLEELVSENNSNTNGTSTNCTGAFAAGGAGIHAYITSVTICNNNASTSGTVDLRDGSAGAVLWTFPAPATGGATHNFDPPLKFSANTAVAYDVSAAISTVYISLNGFFAQG